MNFKELHYQDKPLVLCNIWDVASARVAEKAGFQAVATASSAFADLFGYEDGRELSFAEQKFMIERITKGIGLPLTVDLEGGYSEDPAEIAANIRTLSELGVVGVNLEDSIVRETRELLEPAVFAARLAAVRARLEEDNVEMFINARVDTYIMSFYGMELPDALGETLKRVEAYEKAGADGVFVPLIVKPEDIAAVTQATKLPLNVSCMPGLPDLDSLTDLGVKRVSMGNLWYAKVLGDLESHLGDFRNDSTLQSIF